MRKFDNVDDIIMLSVASFWKPENDMFYIKGEKVGEERGMQKVHTQVVRNLIVETKWSDEKIAGVAGVTAEFVKKIRAKNQ